MSSLSGKVAIVTGASRGIGARIASRLAQAGAGVVVNYAGRRDAAEHVVQSIEAGGGRALAVQGDVSKPQDVRAWPPRSMRRSMSRVFGFTTTNSPEGAEKLGLVSTAARA